MEAVHSLQSIAKLCVISNHLSLVGARLSTRVIQGNVVLAMDTTTPMI